MKPCKICGDRPAAKGRTICETCKKQRQRDGKSQVQETQSKPKRVSPVQAPQSPGELKGRDTPEVQESLTPADEKWWLKNAVMGDEWPTWGELQQNQCATCKKKFDTRLRLLKSCADCATV